MHWQYIHTYIHACMHAYIHTYIHTLHKYVYIYIYIYTYYSGVVRITLLLGKHTWRCHGTKFWIPFLHWLGLLSCLGNSLGLLGGVMGLSLGLLLCPRIFLKIIVERECLFAFPLACSRKFCNSNHNVGKQCAHICLAHVPKQGLVFLHTNVYI